MALSAWDLLGKFPATIWLIWVLLVRQLPPQRSYFTMILLSTSLTPFTPLASATALSDSAFVFALPLSCTMPLASVSTLMRIALTCLSFAISALILAVITESLTASLKPSAWTMAGAASAPITRAAAARILAFM